MQQESRGKRMFQKLRRSLMAVVMGIAVMTNAMVVSAMDLNEKITVEQEFDQEFKEASSPHNLGKVTTELEFYKFSIKSPGKVKLKISGLSKKQKVYMVLYDKDYTSLTGDQKSLVFSESSMVFYLKSAGTYYFRLKCDSGETVNVSYTFEKRSNQGGTSFAKAVTLKKSEKKNGILGFDWPVEKNQYYKLKVAKEELVKIKFAKGNSSSDRDTLKVIVYKLINKKKQRIDVGHLFEGQKSGTFYIRNSENHKTEPGTYYIVVSKVYQTSGFDYSLTWLNK